MKDEGKSSEQPDASTAPFVQKSETEEDGSQQLRDRRKPNTGKEDVPGHDGTITMREYERRVRLFQSVTGVDKEYQAGKFN